MCCSVLRGTQTAAAGATAADECVPCEPGFHCPESGVSLPCDEGYICLEGATTAAPVDGKTGKQCDAGFYCPRGSFKMLPCRPGTTSAKGASSCTPCEAGKFCPWPGTPAGDPAGVKACPAGHACPEGSARPLPCPVGTFQADAGATECTPCPEGHYCGEGGLRAASGKCFVGFVCGGAAGTPADWDQVFGLDGAVSGRCPKGHKCDTAGARPVACEPGTYQDSTTSTECKPCPPGKFCSAAGLQEPSGDCAAGFFCTAGSKTARPGPGNEGGACPAGWVCPEGSAAPRGCPLGQYTEEEGQQACQACPAGKFCLKAGEAPQPCKSGHVCDAGSGVGRPCPAGSYFKASNAATTAGSCLPCTLGHYCRAGQIAGPCAPGFLCGLGNWLPNPNADYMPPSPFIPSSESHSAVLLTLENWRNLAAGVSLYGGIPCPPGHYCVAGATTPAACGANTARLETGGRWKNDCSLCPAGYFCKDNDPVPYPCPRGFYCPFASREPSPCPEGTLGSREKAESLGDCVSCPSGFHCPAGTSDLADDGLLCSAGYYCPEGTKEPVPCIPGTYNAFTGGASAESCLPCPAGFFCSSEGTARPTSICPAGYYCPAGSMSPVICPPSSFCPLQSSAPKACAAAGFYCPLGAPSPEPCPSGALCVAGAREPTLCPKGTFLPPPAVGTVGGSEAQCVICPAGSFADAAGSTGCSICSAGFLCYEGCISSEPESKETDKGQLCPLGHFCLPGALEASPCPAGSAGMRRGLKAEEDCTLCPAGTFNELSGQSTCSMCGASATSVPGSLTCNCKGENRMFQPSDKSCVCKPGFIFLKNGVDMASEDGDGNCYQVVHERCGTGQSRDASGDCVDPSTACVDECGEGGGEFNEVSGLCMCFTTPSQISECGLACQRQATRMLLADDTFVFEETLSSGDIQTVAEISLASLRPDRLAGTPACTAGERCILQLQDLTTGYMASLFGAPSALIAELQNLARGLAPHARRRATIQASETLLGVPWPVQCLPVGTTVVWRLGKNNYPVYVKDSLVNTNREFDYGSFRQLEWEVQAGVDYVLFAYTFNEPGVYVFASSLNPKQYSILRFLDEKLKCRDSATVPRRRTRESLAAVGIRLNPDIYEVADWGSMLRLVIAAVVLIGLLLVWGWVLNVQDLDFDVEDVTALPYRRRHLLFQVPGVLRPEKASLGFEAQEAHKERAREGALQLLQGVDPRIVAGSLELISKTSEYVAEIAQTLREKRAEKERELHRLMQEMSKAIADEFRDFFSKQAWMASDAQNRDCVEQILKYLRMPRRLLVQEMARAQETREAESELLDASESKSVEIMRRRSTVLGICEEAPEHVLDLRAKVRLTGTPSSSFLPSARETFVVPHARRDLACAAEVGAGGVVPRIPSVYRPQVGSFLGQFLHESLQDASEMLCTLGTALGQQRQSEASSIQTFLRARDSALVSAENDIISCHGALQGAVRRGEKTADVACDSLDKMLLASVKEVNARFVAASASDQEAHEAAMQATASLLRDWVQRQAMEIEEKAKNARTDVVHYLSTVHEREERSLKEMMEAKQATLLAALAERQDAEVKATEERLRWDYERETGPIAEGATNGGALRELMELAEESVDPDFSKSVASFGRVLRESMGGGAKVSNAETEAAFVRSRQLIQRKVRELIEAAEAKLTVKDEREYDALKDKYKTGLKNCLSAGDAGFNRVKSDLERAEDAEVDAERRLETFIQEQLVLEEQARLQRGVDEDMRRFERAIVRAECHKEAEKRRLTEMYLIRRLTFITSELWASLRVYRQLEAQGASLSENAFPCLRVGHSLKDRVSAIRTWQDERTALEDDLRKRIQSSKQQAEETRRSHEASLIVVLANEVERVQEDAKAEDEEDAFSVKMKSTAVPLPLRTAAELGFTKEPTELEIEARRLREKLKAAAYSALEDKDRLIGVIRTQLNEIEARLDEERKAQQDAWRQRLEGREDGLQAEDGREAIRARHLEELEAYQQLRNEELAFALYQAKADYMHNHPRDEAATEEVQRRYWEGLQEELDGVRQELQEKHEFTLAKLKERHAAELGQALGELASETQQEGVTSEDERRENVQQESGAEAVRWRVSHLQ
ncbi:hypothetical protein NCLIV_002800 [Neospora caninum Liverpool]|uniref:Tyrosine-protein kinase ephrin type A/B receptor-like domain-containing protein n=1 Tax=Neospora caninum (strain Liverpool) TaxID=572307 RepID=F0V7V1_NEOCL|nr:hypothetical protein NCLIV_002800 [Neospora caninum Liverpool]CBZ49792.1 hypothetical protein NCLIV_002800 [Neospora caninum Liverpool]|eukprot:XP_003879827.1 hypothetical protein NCLIV_002800 [Neospora caninum Liverpool]